MPEYFDAKRMTWIPVRRFKFTAHDETVIVIWHQNIVKADYEFERSRWGGKPKQMIELGPDEECVGR